MNSEQIVAIIRKHKEECEQAAMKFDGLASSSRATELAIQRKQYAIAAQIELLDAILGEIGPVEEEYWIEDHPLLHDDN